MKIFLIIAIVFTMSSCAKYIAPQKVNFDNTQKYQYSTDKLWQKISMFCVENNFSIINSDKNANLIVAEGDLAKITGFEHDNWKGLVEKNSVGSCGESGVLKFYPVKARFSIFIENEQALNNVKVIVNFIEVNPKPNENAAGIIRCESNGVLEKMLFDYLSR